MEEKKKKRLEDQLRMLIAEANLEKDQIPAIKKEANPVRVIRRRKGQPDQVIA